MFGGSDEFVLREIADESHNIRKVIDILMKHSIELEFANDLKLYELGKIDENTFQQKIKTYRDNQVQLNKYIFNQ